MLHAPLRSAFTYLLTIGHTSVDIGASASLELLDKFCYLGGRLSVALILFKILALYKSFTYLLMQLLHQ